MRFIRLRDAVGPVTLPTPTGSPAMADDALRSRAARAAVYGYATVDMYRILHDFALDAASPEHKGPFNALAHSRQLADPGDRAIVAMNVDHRPEEPTS
jgi:hypothetical protein